MRDNQTVAGEQDIVRDHDLVKRTHSKGILFPDTWWDGPGFCSMYFFEGAVTGERGGKGDTTMNMVLRPGEAIVWRWGQLNPLKYHGVLMTMPTYPATICNGLWEYRPDFSKETWRKGATSVENITAGNDGLAAEERQAGHDHLDHAQPLRAGGRPVGSGGCGRQVLHLGGRQDVAGG